MEISQIEDKDLWENFLQGSKEKTFLDSWNWGEFQKKEGNRIWRWGIYDNNGLGGVVLLVKIKAKRGTFLFVPHGPVVKNQNPKIKVQILNSLLNDLKKTAGSEGAGFIRIAPIWERNKENEAIFKDLGFKEAPIHMHPELTWELDTNLPEEELSANMRKTTRYLIKQAQKNQDIQIIKSENIDNLKYFSEVYEKTAKRHSFTPYSFDYLRNELESFGDDNQFLMFLGKYKNKVVSSAIIIYWQNVGFYHHGASLSEYNRIPVSYLLQWEAIREAKKRGCKTYNFWGVAEKNWKLEIGNWKFGKHPWQGLSMFKMGFGGRAKEYVKTQDFILSPRYYFNYLVEKARKIKRGL